MSNQENDDRVVIYTRVSSDINDRLENLKADYGINKGALVSILVGIGLNYLLAMLNPEQLLSADKMAEIMEKSQEKGVKFYEPD